MMRAMKGTRMAAATELLLEAKWRPMDSGSDSSSLRSAKSQSRNLRSQTRWPLLGSGVRLGVLPRAHRLPPPPNWAIPWRRVVSPHVLVRPAEASLLENLKLCPRALKECSPLEVFKLLLALEAFYHVKPSKEAKL